MKLLWVTVEMLLGKSLGKSEWNDIAAGKSSSGANNAMEPYIIL